MVFFLSESRRIIETILYILKTIINVILCIVILNKVSLYKHTIYSYVELFFHLCVTHRPIQSI